MKQEKEADEKLEKYEEKVGIGEYERSLDTLLSETDCKSFKIY